MHRGGVAVGVISPLSGTPPVLIFDHTPLALDQEDRNVAEGPGWLGFLRSFQPVALDGSKVD